MRVGVGELDGDRGDLEAQWNALVTASIGADIGLLVLPEMPFSRWLPTTPEVEAAAWGLAVDTHEHWCSRLGELNAEVVVTTRPILDRGVRYNEGIVWTSGECIVGRRRKTFLPDEPGFHEASWYERGPVAFPTIATSLGAVGLMICTELWFLEHARGLGERGIRLLAVPRATPVESREKWEAGVRVAAVASGAFCLSTNRAGGRGGDTFGSGSVIADPDGLVVARSTPGTPLTLADIDLDAADRAKHSYPRYVDASS